MYKRQVRIPGGEGFILLDSAAVGHVQDGADDGLVGFQFAALFVFDADGAVFIQDDEVNVCVFHRAEIFRVDNAEMCIRDSPDGADLKPIHLLKPQVILKALLGTKTVL